MLREPLMNTEETELEAKVSKRFSLLRNIPQITITSGLMLISYAYSGMILYGNVIALELEESAGAGFFLTLVDFGVVASACSCLVIGFISKEPYNELQQLKEELIIEQQGDQKLLEELPTDSSSTEQKIQEKIHFISNLPITGMQLATPFIIGCAGIFAGSSFVLPLMGVDRSTAESFRWASLISIPSLPLYAFRFGNEKILFAAEKYLFIIMASITGLVLGVVAENELCLNQNWGVTGMAASMLVENIFTTTVTMLGIHFMSAFKDIPFRRSILSCGDQTIREGIKPISRSINYTYSSEWLCALFRSYVANKVGPIAGAAQNYVTQIYVTVFMVSNAVSEAISLGLKAIPKAVAQELKIPINVAKTHPVTQRLQCRYAHTGILTGTIINGALVILVSVNREILTTWLNPNVSSQVKEAGDSVILYGGACSLLFGAAVMMRQAQASQVNYWAHKTYNTVIWVGGASYSAVAALVFNQGLKGVNQGALFGAFLGFLAVLPGYLNAFSPTSRVTSVLNNIGSGLSNLSNNCSNLFGSIKRRIWNSSTVQPTIQGQSIPPLTP